MMMMMMVMMAMMLMMMMITISYIITVSLLKSLQHMPSSVSLASMLSSHLAFLTST